MKSDVELKAIEENSSDLLSGRHRLIAYTSLASTLARWADALRRDRRRDQALETIKEAHLWLTKATELDPQDIPAQDKLHDICLQFALTLKGAEGNEAARPYFKKAIKFNARRVAERRTTETACFHLAESLIEDGAIEEAQRYAATGPPPG
jgi:tetratricopeptide (TPR) repeat protein